MKRRWMAAAGGTLAAIGLATATVVAPAGASQDTPASGQPGTTQSEAQSKATHGSARERTAAAGNGFFNADGVNIRTGPSTGYTSLGLGYKGQRIQVHCDRAGAAGDWWNITNLATGVSGYVFWPDDPVNVLLDYGTPDPPNC